jgi:D-lactate dehydrogenase (cytochrome)
VNRHSIRARAPRGRSGRVELFTDSDRLAAYLEDAAHVPGGHARAVAVPIDEQQVADAIALSGRVLVVGAQSSLTGGATPRGDTVLSTARLQTLADLADGRLRAGAGITIAEIDTWLRRRGALYPPGPTWTGATVGGTVATNAAGAATFKYGMTRAWVDAVTVVLASGDVLDIERGSVTAHPEGYFDVELAERSVRVPVPAYRMPAVPKVSAGYFAAPGMDLIDLFIGAEGTLGIVTEVTLRVRSDRPATCLAFLTSRDLAAALAFVGALREEAQHTWRTAAADGLDVSAIEHMDARSLAFLREDGVDRRLGVSLGAEAAIGLLLTIELQGTPVASVQRLSNLIEAHLPGEDAIVAMPDDESSARRLLALREAVPLAVNHRIARAQRDIDPRIEKTAADVIVPFERIGELLAYFAIEAGGRGLDLAVWGHISDGNMHPNVIPRSFNEVEAGREAILAFGREAIRLGGAPMAEHGVGRSRIKQRLLRELYGDVGVDAMRAVKRALDPHGKLAPGVLFDTLEVSTAG